MTTSPRLVIEKVKAKRESISIDGGDSGRVTLGPDGKRVFVEMRTVQFNVAFFENLIHFVRDDRIKVSLDGHLLSIDDLNDLKHRDLTEIEDGVAGIDGIQAICMSVCA